MRNLRYLIALFLAAFALRAAYDLRQPAHAIVQDTGSFDSIAWNVATHDEYDAPWDLRVEGRYDGREIVPTTYRPPSYVLFLAAIYKTAGHSVTAVLLVQALMGALLSLMIFQLARQVSSNPWAPWLAGSMAAFYPFFIYYEGEIISDGFVTFCTVLCLLLFFAWREKPLSWLRAAACGLGFAVLILAKTLLIPYVLVLIAWYVFETPAGAERVQRWARLALMGIMFAAPLVLWGLRNKHVMGKFVLDTHGGKTSVECIMFYTQCKQGTFGPFFKDQPLQKAAMGLGEVQMDTLYLNATRQFIREHPARYLRQSLGNLKDFWRLYPRQDLDYKEGRLKITLISVTTESFLLIAGLIGVIKTRARWRSLVPLYLLIVVLSGLHALTTGQMRYRLPLMPLAIIFSAAAVTP